MIFAVDDLKAIAGIDVDADDHTVDDALTEIIESVQSDIEGFLNQPIESGAVVYQFVGNGTFTHTLPYSQCSAVATPQTRDTPVDAWQSVTGSVVVARSTSPASIYHEDGWSEGTDYRATVTVGWSAIPATVLHVAREMCLIRYQELGHGDAKSGRLLGVASRATQSGGIAATTSYMDMVPRWEKALSKYRIIPV